MNEWKPAKVKSEVLTVGCDAATPHVDENIVRHKNQGPHNHVAIVLCSTASDEHFGILSLIMYLRGDISWAADRNL